MAETTDNGIILTADQVREWRHRKGEIEQSVVDLQKELANINRRLEAVAILMGPEWPIDRLDRAVALSRQDASAEATSEDSAGNMMASIERIVTEAKAPLAKSQIKDALRRQGFPEERLGNYFYTCIKRLKERHRITVRQDGSAVLPNPFS